MRGCASPRTRAVSSRICLPDRVAGPGRSNHALAAGGSSSARTSAVDDVVDRDRLGPRFQPPRQDHDGQPRRQIAHDEPAQAAKSDDHAGAQLDRLDRTGAQSFAHVEPAAQMLRCGARGRDAAEVDDPADAGSCGGLGERRGRGALAPVVVGALTDSVHEVDGGACTRRARGRTMPRSPTSPSTHSSAGWRPRARVASRVRQRTRHPALDSAGRTAPPTKPVAPVSRTVRSALAKCPPAWRCSHGTRGRLPRLS